MFDLRPFQFDKVICNKVSAWIYKYYTICTSAVEYCVQIVSICIELFTSCCSKLFIKFRLLFTKKAPPPPAFSSSADLTNSKWAFCFGAISFDLSCGRRSPQGINPTLANTLALVCLMYLLGLYGICGTGGDRVVAGCVLFRTNNQEEDTYLHRIYSFTSR